MIYLDTNVFIYAIENHPKYGESCKRILMDLENGKIKAYSSVLVLVEAINVLTKINKLLKREGKKPLDIKENINAILSYPIVWIDLGIFVIKRASEYDYNMLGIDYIHVASMEINSIKKIISTDEEFDEVDIIERIGPLDYKK